MPDLVPPASGDPASAPDGRRTSAGAARLIQSAPGRFRLEGDLDLAGVAALAAAGARLLPADPHRRARRAAAPSSGLPATAAPAVAAVELDLAGVGQASSAAVALLLEWTDQVAAAGLRLTCTNWPATMARIADLSNVGELLRTPGRARLAPAPDSHYAPSFAPPDDPPRAPPHDPRKTLAPHGQTPDHRR